jgi:hypothetical protein
MELQDVGLGSMDWSNLSQDRERWRALMTETINSRVS